MERCSTGPAHSTFSHAPRITTPVQPRPLHVLMFEVEESWGEEAGQGESALRGALFGPVPSIDLGPRETRRKKSTCRRKRRREETRLSEGGRDDTPLPEQDDTSATTRVSGESGRTRRRRKYEKEWSTEDENGSSDSCVGSSVRPIKGARAASPTMAKGLARLKKTQTTKRKSQKIKVSVRDEGEEGTEAPNVSCSGSGKRGAHRGLNPLRKKAASKMEGARFRWLNEQLYTSTSREAMALFRDDPKLFEIYHQGFETQISKWPLDPLDHVIADIQSLPASTVIADMGCGRARLAHSVPHRVHSFDLVALDSHVTACDMAHVPLPNASVDMCVFCLSLMGTNTVEFIREARRVLRRGGTLKVLEIESRITSLDRFVSDVEALGFSLVHKRNFSKMFVDMAFTAVVETGMTSPTIQLKPCTYKKR